jgi:hypothetical protein
MVTVFGRGGVGAALIQRGKGMRLGGTLIRLLKHGRLWRMAHTARWPVERAVATRRQEEGGES